MPERLLNWELLANPANWLVVFLMLSTFALVITALKGATLGS
jgi:hypothetical protein